MTQMLDLLALVYRPLQLRCRDRLPARWATGARRRAHVQELERIVSLLAGRGCAMCGSLGATSRS